MQTLVAGGILTLAAVVSLIFSLWQNERAQDAGRRAADAGLEAMRQHRAASDAHRAEGARLLRLQRRHASLAYAAKRVGIVTLTIGLLGVLGGALVQIG